MSLLFGRSGWFGWCRAFRLLARRRRPRKGLGWRSSSSSTTTTTIVSNPCKSRVDDDLGIVQVDFLSRVQVLDDEPLESLLVLVEKALDGARVGKVMHALAGS